MKVSKRILSLILVMALVFSVLPMGAAAASDVLHGIAFTKANLRLRSEASTSSSSLATASKGEVVLVLNESDNGWYKVSFNGQEGYMSGTYLDVETTGHAELGYGTINASKVNLRKGPGASHGIVAVGTKGATAYVVGIENGWFRIIFGSNIGFIRSDYLDLTEIPYENKASSKSPVFYRGGASTGVEVSASALKNNGSGSSGSASSGSSSSGSSSSKPSTGSSGSTAATATGQIHGIAFTTGSGLRLRSAANTSSKTLASASKGEVVIVLEKNGDWCKVLYNLKEGYMHADYLKIQTTGNAELGYGSVTGNNVNLRSGAGTSAKKVASSDKGDKAYIVGVENGWYRVIFAGKVCYIRSDYLALTEAPYENKASSKSPIFYRGGNSTGVTVSASALGGNSGSSSSASASKPSGSAAGQKIVETAKKYLGVPYVYGGTSPKGFDCSGLVYYVLKSHGITVSRSSAAMYKCGTPISKSELQPGDLVFFQNTYTAGISHVGIYAGNGQFIHSPHRGKMVCYADLNSDYYTSHYYGAIRVV